jgi:hypothetical protein
MTEPQLTACRSAGQNLTLNFLSQFFMRVGMSISDQSVKNKSPDIVVAVVVAYTHTAAVKQQSVWQHGTQD